MKRSGALSRETPQGVRRVSRKFKWYPTAHDVWHLLDTVDAHRLVIDRLLDAWSVPMSPNDDLYGWWIDDERFDASHPEDDG